MSLPSPLPLPTLNFVKITVILLVDPGSPLASGKLEAPNYNDGSHCRLEARTNTMAARLTITDILHRGVLFGLVGLGVGGIALGVQVHRETLKKGKGAKLCRSTANFS